MKKSKRSGPWNSPHPIRTIEPSIEADPWVMQPHTKKSIPCSSNNLSFDIKAAALKASASVVGILTHLGGKEILRGSGFVIESYYSSNGKFVNMILTSATILRAEPHIDELMKDIEIDVILANNITCRGIVSAFNFHYNIGMIEFSTDVALETARLRHIDDSISIDPNLLDDNPPHYQSQSDKYVLVPGDTVVALGRYPAGQNRLMVVAGEFCVNKMKLDCQELFKADCKISMHGIGGPVINCYGEVIGISFFCASFTPFLPINIISMWREQLKRNSHHLVPQLGMQLVNLYKWGAHYLEIVLQRFPTIFKGIVINEITSESPAFAKILSRDIIVKCDGKPVESVLEFFEMIWHKVGEPVDLTVLRPSEGSRQNITIIVGTVQPNQTNSWPFSMGGPNLWNRLRKRERT